MTSDAEASHRPRVHFIANGVYNDALAGGDIHFLQMAKALVDAGYPLNFFGGYALRRRIEQDFNSTRFTLTDSKNPPPFDAASFRGQMRLFLDYTRRFLCASRRLACIASADVVYAASDYWFDVLPAALSRARNKMMILHMEAPTLPEILQRSRPDVDPRRLASIHYWMSQRLALAVFRRCRNKALLYVHPAMRPKLLRLGYSQEELRYASFGVEEMTPRSSPKRYDVVWIGRLHRQKGVDDLIATLRHLAERVPAFRAVLIGNLRHQLKPMIDRLELSTAVELAGFVSEEQKFELFQQSRLFLMPSRFEGSPRAIAEALVCNVPVVAYDVPTYRPLFHDFVQYVPSFDLARFQREAENQILRMRAGVNYLDQLDLAQFRRENSWETVQRMFCQTIADLQVRSELRSDRG